MPCNILADGIVHNCKSVLAKQITGGFGCDSAECCQELEGIREGREECISSDHPELVQTMCVNVHDRLVDLCTRESSQTKAEEANTENRLNMEVDEEFVEEVPQ